MSLTLLWIVAIYKINTEKSTVHVINKFSYSYTKVMSNSRRLYQNSLNSMLKVIMVKRGLRGKCVWLQRVRTATFLVCSDCFRYSKQHSYKNKEIFLCRSPYLLNNICYNLPELCCFQEIRSSSSRYIVSL